MKISIEIKRPLLISVGLLMLTLAHQKTLLFADILDEIEKEQPSPKAPSDTLRLPSESKTIEYQAEDRLPNSQKTSEARELESVKGSKKNRSKLPKDELAAQSGSAAARGPVKFESRGLRGQRDQGVVELLDNVVVTQDDLRMESKEAKVFFDEKNRDVVKVHASGDVRIFKDSAANNERMKAFGDLVTFNNKERVIVIEGRARLWRGSNLVEGKKIVYEMENGWVKGDQVSGELRPENASQQTKSTPHESRDVSRESVKSAVKN